MVQQHHPLSSSSSSSSLSSLVWPTTSCSAIVHQEQCYTSNNEQFFRCHHHHYRERCNKIKSIGFSKSTKVTTMLIIILHVSFCSTIIALFSSSSRASSKSCMVTVVDASIVNPSSTTTSSTRSLVSSLFHRRHSSTRRKEQPQQHQQEEGNGEIKIYKDKDGTFEFFVLPTTTTTQPETKQQESKSSSTDSNSSNGFRMVNHPDFVGLERNFVFGSSSSSSYNNKNNMIVNHDPILRMTLTKRSSYYGEPHETLGSSTGTGSSITTGGSSCGAKSKATATAASAPFVLRSSLLKKFQNRLHERTTLVSNLLKQRRQTLRVTATNVACMCGHQWHMIEHTLNDIFVIPNGLPNNVLNAVHHHANSIVHNAVVRSNTNRKSSKDNSNDLWRTMEDENNIQDNNMFVADPDSILSSTERKEIVNETLELMESVNEALSNENIWEFLIEKNGIKVWRTYENVKQLKKQKSNSNSDMMNNNQQNNNKSVKEDNNINNNTNTNNNNDSATIRSEAILNASPEQVYKLFMDNNRVHEYNDNCVDLYDIEYLDYNTKLNWCATGKFGMFKPRDFITIVHFNKLPNNEGYMSIAANMKSGHPKLPTLSTHVRSEVQLSATFMKCIKNKPNQTKFIQLTQVGNLGGIADNPLAQRMASKMSQTAPIDFITKFNRALQSTTTSTTTSSSSDVTKKSNGVVNVKSLPFYKHGRENSESEITRRRIVQQQPMAESTTTTTNNKDLLDV